MRTDKKIILISTVVMVIIVVGAAFLLGDKSGQTPSTNQSSGPTALNDLVGKSAPDFTLEGYDGQKISISALKGKNVVLFFSEGLMCYPACWNQIAAFGSDSGFADKNTVVLVIVNDPKSEWKGAIEKMPELATATLFLPSSMHKGQLPGHTYVVIDKEGIVRFVKDDPQMAIRNQEILTDLGQI